MKFESLKEAVLPPGPILALTLIGLLLLSAVLYYRAIEIQRFLEPALALSQPRNEVAEDFNQLLVREFGRDSVTGIRFVMGSILVDESMLFTADHQIKETAQDMLRKLSRVFTSALSEKHSGSYVDLILVSTRYPLGSDIVVNAGLRRRTQHQSELLLESMYRLDPALEKNFGHYFIPAALPVPSSEKTANLVEFRIVPGEMLHIEVLTRLRKYVK